VSAAYTIDLMPAEQYEAETARRESAFPQIWDVLDTVKDPEIPVLSIWELGILRGVEMDGDTVVVTITPTYSGCPAMDAVAEDIVTGLAATGYRHCRINTQWSPAWSTSWMSPEGRKKLREYGIAPPGEQALSCPHCNSREVELVSEFGSTACKALYRCQSCFEPFDFFKNL
jgi:ring-1,2-phenylacetyl-CoA epoxidase subunit PaaD